MDEGYSELTKDPVHVEAMECFVKNYYKILDKRDATRDSMARKWRSSRWVRGWGSYACMIDRAYMHMITSLIKNLGIAPEDFSDSARDYIARECFEGGLAEWEKAAKNY